MLDISLAVLAVLIALTLRSEPLRRLRPLTAPLLIAAIAAVAHFLAESLDVEALRDETGAVVSPAGMVAQLKSHLLRFVGR
jgi:hypothetical protein